MGSFISFSHGSTQTQVDIETRWTSASYARQRAAGVSALCRAPAQRDLVLENLLPSGRGRQRALRPFMFLSVPTGTTTSSALLE